MAKLTIYTDTCKGCGLCIGACPKELLAIDNSHLNAKGYHPIGIGHPEDCIGCASCARMCPDCALEVDR